MLFGKKKIIGLDIGSSTIKLAELDVGRKKSNLVSFGMVPTPVGAVADGDIINPELVAEAIQTLVADVRTKRKLVATALWGSSVIVKKISVPQMDPSLIGEQIRWEAEQYIPYDVNEVNLEYEVLSKAGSSQETMDLLLVAAVQEAAFKCAETINMAGLQCAVLDVGGFALANAFKSNYGNMSGQVIALLNIGASATNFVILENSEVVFCRDVPIGGNVYTAEIQKSLDLPTEEAEAMKLSYSAGEQVPDQVGQAVQSVHEVVADEVGGIVDFYLNTSEADKIDRCFVSGGCAKVPGLLKHLSNTIQCEPFDPFIHVKFSPKVFNPGYINQIRDFSAVVLGLAMRGVGEK